MIDTAITVFNIIFIIECVLKVIAKGLIMHKNSYMQSGWDLIDLLVVITAIFELIPALNNISGFKALRSVRALRPLRFINAIPSMKKLVKILITSLPNLANVVGLLSFIILLFALLGLHSLSGNLYYRCRTTEFPVNSTYWPILEEYESLCNPNNGIHACPEESFCGHPS